VHDYYDIFCTAYFICILLSSVTIRIQYIRLDGKSESLTVISYFRILQRSVATQLGEVKVCIVDYSVDFFGDPLVN